MTSQCPRCAAPRLGDYPFCHQCAFDFRNAAAHALPPQQQLPAQQPLYGASPQPPLYQQPDPWAFTGQPVTPQPPAYEPPAVAPPAPAAPQTLNAPSVCLRCHAPLHPSYSQCGNCGFDNAAAWATPAPATPAGLPALPVALGVLGAGLLIAAGALFMVAR
jgi:hypothetical protein